MSLSSGRSWLLAAALQELVMSSLIPQEVTDVRRHGVDRLLPLFVAALPLFLPLLYDSFLSFASSLAPYAAPVEDGV